MNRIIIKIAVLLLAMSVSAALAGCAPRGETVSLEQAVKNELDRFQRVRRTNIPEEAREMVDATDNLLASLLRSPESTHELWQVSELLSKLTQKAGFTSRPAFTELAKQYRVLSSQVQAQNQINENGVALLVGRTYSLLASELETTAFSL
jgi:PBP1b-binding outer membrane lipoprotein LpoB